MLLVIILIVLILIILSYTEFNRYLRLTLVRDSKDLLGYAKAYVKLPRVISDSRVVITLTTIPSRLDGVIYTLKSLFDQSCRVDQIYLCLPWIAKRSGKEYVIPDILKKLEDICPHFTIYRVDDDYGPITKVYPVLKVEDDDTRVIYVDDDHIYGKHMIEELVRESQKFPESAIAVKVIKGLDVVQGYGGVLVRRSFFDNINCLIDYGEDEVGLAGQMEDDFWISGHLSRCGIKRRRLPFSFKTFPYPYTLNMKDALCGSVNRDKKNANLLTEYFSPGGLSNGNN